MKENRDKYESAFKIVNIIKTRKLRFASQLTIVLAQILSGRVASYGRQLDEIEKTVESYPFSSIILINVAEIWLALGDRQKTEQLLKKSYTIIEEKHMDFSDSELVLTLNQIALLEAKMGIKSDTLLRNYRILQKFTRSDSTNEGYFSLAMTVADCMHISKKHYYQHAHLIERCIAKISRKEERNDSYGFAARKLCMRTETEPADDMNLMELAELLLPKITNNLDKLITHIQLGIAKALRHDVEGAKKHFDLCAAMTERASEQTKCVTDTHLFRAYVISGFTSEAYAMEHELKERFRDICDSGHLRANIIQQESSSLRIKIPKILENVVKELRHMEDAYIDTILSSFILAARLSKNRYYIDEAKKMTYQILSGYAKFNLYNQISVVYAEINCADKALNTLYLGIKDLEHAHKKIIPRKLFPDIGISCAQNYFYTSDERFVDTFLQYAHVFRIKGRSLARACYEFCSTMAALAKDKKWNLACYVHYAD